MEIARLFDQELNIVNEWFQLTSDGFLRNDIIKKLETKYRIHSHKKAFTCLCCSQPVSLVLREDSPHFRHQGERCPSAENYITHTRLIDNHENGQIHRAGRAILKTYLEGQLKIRGVTVQEGYMYRSQLRIVPDFILSFPDGSIWSVDYVTGKREDESYKNYISKRTKIYRSAGFKPHYFIDFSWIADIPERSIVALYLAEMQMKSHSKVDTHWSEFVQEFIDVFGASFVLQELFGVQQKNFDDPVLEFVEGKVYSLTYVDPGSGKAWIHRIIPANQKFGYLIHRSQIPLEKAASLNNELNEFQWWADDETEDMRKALERLTNAFEMQSSQMLNVEWNEVALEKEDLSSEIALDFTLEDEHNLEKQTVPFMELKSGTIENRISSMMSTTDAWQIYDFLSLNKGRIPSIERKAIRLRAFNIIGLIENPNQISAELRKALIEIATISN
ncbi:hypothetical protein ACLBWT_18795 [Paenibacillus sp. D51F]